LDTLEAMTDSNKQKDTVVEEAQTVELEKKVVKSTPKKPSTEIGNKKKPEKSKTFQESSEAEIEDIMLTIALESKEQDLKQTNGSIDLEKTEIKLELAPAEGDFQVEELLPPQQNESFKGNSQANMVKEIEQIDDIEEDTQKDRFLSFRIREEDYGIEIRFVTEIIVMHKITVVPDTPPFIKGVINLRGKVIPVMDVRERFKMETRDYDDRTCIIVVDVDEITLGLIVDTVNEVVDIPETQIDAPPATHSGIESNYIKGMGKVGKKVKILLDVERVLILN